LTLSSGCATIGDTIIGAKKIVKANRSFKFRGKDFKVSRDGRGLKLEGPLSQSERLTMSIKAKIDADLNSVDGGSAHINFIYRF
jgi:hypothetical protein